VAGSGVVRAALEAQGFSDVVVESIDEPSMEDVFMDRVGARGDGGHETD